MLVQEKEGRILDAARLLFERQGLRKTTIEQIAEEAGIGKGTIYLYFPSKVDIMAAVVRQEMESFITQVRQELRKEESATEKIKKYLLVRFRHHAHLIERHNLTPEKMFEFHAEAALQDLKKEYFAVQRQILMNVLEVGMERGEFGKLRVIEVATTLLYTMESCSGIWQLNGLTLKPEEQVRLYCNLVLNGLSKRE